MLRRHLQRPRFEAPPPAMRDRDSISVRWAAHDDNDDELVYSVYYRGDNETQWKLLKDKITDKFYSLDAGVVSRRRLHHQGGRLRCALALAR